MNQNASPKFEILSLFEKGQSERLLKLDKLLLAALTLIYAVIALLNLGTLSFPTSVYEGAVDAPLHSRRRRGGDLHSGPGGHVQVA